MDIAHLQVLYANNIENIFKPDRFKELANHSNNIQGYSFLNRALIYIQNRYCTEVKSEASWQLDGHIVSDNAIPMGIITPILNTKYFDIESGKEIKATELNQGEFNKALMLGIINKEVSIEDIKCTLVYDVRDTTYTGEEKSKMQRRIKLSTLLELLDSIGISVVRSDNEETSFDKCTNTLKIGSDGLHEKIRISVEALANNYIIQCKSSIDLGELGEKLIQEYMVYSVLTYFNINSTINFEYISELYNNIIEMDTLSSFIDILDDIEHILNVNIFSAENPSGYAVDEGHKTYIAHKAAILLNILEANYELNGLRGD